MGSDRNSFWTWLAEVTMPGATIPALLACWALNAWLGLPLFVSMALSAAIIAAAAAVYAVFAARRASPPANRESSVSGKVGDV